ncbi:hypothetical protein A2U01_0038911, partial [Trifolium medium]|nr:hypothetical protein [Trifolium medium]
VGELTQTKTSDATLGEDDKIESGGETLAESGSGNKWRQLKISVFEGDGAFGWESKLENYFLLGGFYLFIFNGSGRWSQDLM